MVASVSSPADVCNNALVRMGFRLRVGTLYDGSDHAQMILDIYAQTRDEKLREFDYDFAQRTGALTLLKSAPVGGYFPPNQWNPANNPPVGYAFEYGFPDDCLKVRNIKRQPLFVVNPDPQPTDFQVSNDNSYTPARRVILSGVPGAIAVYTGQVTDPGTWDVAFTDAFAASLAERLGPALVGGNAKQMAAAEEIPETALAEAGQR